MPPPCGSCRFPSPSPRAACDGRVTLRRTAPRCRRSGSRDRRSAGRSRRRTVPACSCGPRSAAPGRPGRGKKVATFRAWASVSRSRNQTSSPFDRNANGTPSLLGVVASLILRRKGVDAGALRLDRRHGAPGPVAQRVVGPRSVRQCVLEQDAHAVREIPAGVLEKSVDLDAGEGFCGSAHALVHGWKISVRCPRGSVTAPRRLIVLWRPAAADLWSSEILNGTRGRRWQALF